MENVRVRIPKIADLKTAIQIYWSMQELDNADIKELFPSASRSTIIKLKQKVKDYMAKEDIPVYGAYSVNTKAAYHVWGLDINDLETRLNKLKKLDLAV